MNTANVTSNNRLHTPQNVMSHQTKHVHIDVAAMDTRIVTSLFHGASLQLLAQTPDAGFRVVFTDQEVHQHLTVQVCMLSMTHQLLHKHHTPLTHTHTHIYYIYVCVCVQYTNLHAYVCMYVYVYTGCWG